MTRPLRILVVAPYPASPATFGAQRRVEGLMRALGQENELSFVGLASDLFDRTRAEEAMRTYCAEVELVPLPEGTGLRKRLAQLQSLASLASYERITLNTPALQEAIDRRLLRQPHDAVLIETPFLAYSRFRLAPARAPRPRLVVDAHNVEFDLARQYGEKSSGLARKLYHAANWRKLRREEIHAWRTADGVAFTSPDDEARARAILPSLRACVVPNGVDTERFSPGEAPRDGRARTVVFFGTMNYFPNLDAVRWLLREIWPIVARSRPDLRLKIIGSHPTPDVLAHAGPRVEIAGLVDDLQRHLDEAMAIVVPLRIGGGTRLKILESLAMGKAIVSTRLGAEGIAVHDGESILLADEPTSIAEGLVRLADDPALAARLGANGRTLAESLYSWPAIGQALEGFLRELVEREPGARATAA